MLFTFTFGVTGGSVADYLAPDVSGGFFLDASEGACWRWLSNDASLVLYFGGDCLPRESEGTSVGVLPQKGGWIRTS